MLRGEIDELIDYLSVVQSNGICLAAKRFETGYYSQHHNANAILNKPSPITAE